MSDSELETKVAYLSGQVTEALKEIKADIHEIKEIYHRHDDDDRRAFRSIAAQLEQVSRAQAKQKGFITGLVCVAGFVGGIAAVMADLSSVL